MNSSARATPAMLRQLEDELALPPFRGIHLGATIINSLVIELYVGNGDWSWKARLKNHLRRLRYGWFPQRRRRREPLYAGRRILVTLSSPNYRGYNLVRPVIEALGPEQSFVLCGSRELPADMPAEAADWSQVMDYDVAAWRAEYNRCKVPWRAVARRWSHIHRMPPGVCDRIVLYLMLSSQGTDGCLAFLRQHRPSAIVVEFDRHGLWSCLILAAKSLGIPTFTLVHGVLNEEAVGYVPLLADKAFCWGEMSRRQFLAAGEVQEKLLVAGCPRLERKLRAAPAEAKRKLGLADGKPVVMLGTMPVRRMESQSLAAMFCDAVEKSGRVQGLVRLHPSEKLMDYADAMRRFPAVRFSANAETTLDESLSAADLVVVHSSGLGSDALVAGRPVVVARLPNLPLGHAAELIEIAHCPAASTAYELAAAIDELLFDATRRQEQLAAAERYVGDFCAAFGPDAARRIAETVHQTAQRTNNCGDSQ